MSDKVIIKDISGLSNKYNKPDKVTLNDNSGGNVTYTFAIENEELKKIYKELITRTSTEYNMPDEIIKVRNYLFYTSSSITTISLNNAKDIGDYAFYNCNKLASVGSVLHNIGSYAFYGCTSLSGIFTIYGSIGGYTFSGVDGYVTRKSSISITRDSVVTSIGSNAFANGLKCSSGTNILDFRNSTFTTIPSACFISQQNNTNISTHIYFPETLESIASGSFSAVTGVTIYFTSIEPPVINGSPWTITYTGIRLCVPYNSIDAYKSQTDLVKYADWIRGYSDENHFSQGEILPPYNEEGLHIKWYTDISLTTEVSAVDDPSIKYYAFATGGA